LLLLILLIEVVVVVVVVPVVVILILLIIKLNNNNNYIPGQHKPASCHLVAFSDKGRGYTRPLLFETIKTEYRVKLHQI